MSQSAASFGVVDFIKWAGWVLFKIDSEGAQKVKRWAFTDSGKSDDVVRTLFSRFAAEARRLPREAKGDYVAWNNAFANFRVLLPNKHWTTLTSSDTRSFLETARKCCTQSQDTSRWDETFAFYWLTYRLSLINEHATPDESKDYISNEEALFNA